MGNLSNVKTNEILPEFQTFLLEKKLVPEKNVMRYMTGAPKSPLDALSLPRRTSTTTPRKADHNG
jgi:hypothetical protein